MDNEETMVEQEDNEVEELLPDDIVEDSEEEPEESLESLMDEGQPAEEQETPKGKQGTSEPGYVQGRIAKAVEKAVRETEARLTAQFEAQYAPIRDRMLEMDAQELVRKGTVKDLETAKELVRYRQGMQPQAKQEQPRNEQGKFTSQQEMIETARTEARIDELKRQAEKIKKNGGPDVIAEFSNNKDIKQRVVSGELDFYDVAEMMKANKRRPPAPVRSPNGVNGQIKGTIMSMTDKQFDQLEKRVQGGERFRE